MASVKTWSSMEGRPYPWPRPVTDVAGDVARSRDRTVSGVHERDGHREAEVPVTKRGDAPPGLDSGLDAAEVGARALGERIEVPHRQREAEELSRPVARRLGW